MLDTVRVSDTRVLVNCIKSYSTRFFKAVRYPEGTKRLGQGLGSAGVMEVSRCWVKIGAGKQRMVGQG
ncbi:hypothetical protein RRG08_005913 [Elysia crispata]|uniref:Uncharacterized protein n=1 Tax=Elysia crispata TaxID=231223 RepID=A0AAE0Y4G8_9GAST|nr:hypothetical protein RRG08_005913 [Elysia crispata]